MGVPDFYSLFHLVQRRQYHKLATELESVHKTAIQTATTNNPDSRFQALLEQAKSLADAAGCFLYMLSDQNQLILQRVLGDISGHVGERFRFGYVLPDGKGMAWDVVRSKEPRMTLEYNRYENGVDELRRAFGSVIEAPLIVADGQVIGVFGVWNEPQGKLFENHHLKQLERFSLLVSVAIQDIRRIDHEIIQGVIDETHAIASHKLVEGGLDSALDEITEKSIRILHTIHNCTSFISLIREEQINGQPTEVLRVRSASTETALKLVRLAEKEVKDFHRKGINGRLSKLTTNGDSHNNDLALIVNDVRENEDYYRLLDQTQSQMSVAIIVNGRTRGVISIESIQLDAFNKSDLEYAKKIADIAAEIIAQHELLEARRNALTKVSSAIQKIDSFDDLMVQIGSAVENIMEKAERVDLGMIEGETILLHHIGKTDFDYQNISIKDGVIGHVAETEQSVRIPNVKAEDWADTYFEFHKSTISEMATPIFDQNNNVIAVMNIESSVPDAFTQNDMGLLKELASLAGIAIDKCELYAKQQRTVAGLQTLDVAYKQIAKISHQMQELEIIEYLSNQVQKLYKNDYDQGKCIIYIAGIDASEYFVPEPYLHCPTQLYQTLPNPIRGEFNDIDLLNNQNTNNSRSNATPQLNYLQLWSEANSVISVPLLVDNELQWVLSIEHKSECAFGPEDENVLSLLLENAGQAIGFIRYREKELKRLRSAYSGLAHSVHSKVNSIKLNVNWLQKTLGDQNTVTPMGKIETKLRAIEELTEEISSYTGKVTDKIHSVRSAIVNLTTVDLGKMLSELKEKGIVSNEIEFEMDFPDDIPNVISEDITLRNGDRVMIKMLNWPNDAKNPFGEVIEILGQAGEHETEIQGILGDFGLPLKFPERVEKEAKKFTEELTEEDLKTRRDFRSITTFTIDPHDAKDFDDAISIEKIGDDLWEVGIHIADVSYYLDKSPILDAEAQERATSIYLVDRVIPMLPEYLSNGLCSLRPNETKRCFSVAVKINKRGTIKGLWIGRTLIHSDRRFTYEEAQEIIETKQGDYKDEIVLLDSIAKKLRAKRMKQGAIAFDREEMRFKLDKDNNPVGVYMKRSLDANKLVEEFMLLANRSVGESIGKVKAKKDKRTFVYRIHDKPDLDKLQDFTDFVNKIGFKFSWEEHTINENLNEVLTEAHQSPFADVVETLAMRSMSKAVYSTNNIGHYGLGFGFYTHFTSPIRRYPDVMAHRLIQRYLDGGASANAEKYESMCKHCSSMEKLAVDAERASVKFMQVKFMEDKIGQTFDAVVNGITDNGIYAEIKDMKCEGMIRLSSIRSDYFTAFPKDFMVRGSKGRVIRFGDEIKIQVTNTDLFKKQIDMVLVE